jgi:hypothetical protein
MTDLQVAFWLICGSGAVTSILAFWVMRLELGLNNAQASISIDYGIHTKRSADKSALISSLQRRIGAMEDRDTEHGLTVGMARALSARINDLESAAAMPTRKPGGMSPERAARLDDWKAKIERDIDDICYGWATGDTQNELAIQFGVSPTMISDALRPYFELHGDPSSHRRRKISRRRIASPFTANNAI